MKKKKNNKAVDFKGFKPEDADAGYNIPERAAATHTLNAEQLTLIRELVTIPSYTGETVGMRAYIRSVLNSIPGVTHRTIDGNMYVIKGDAEIYPCVVAHTDTVHRMCHDTEVFISGDILFSMDMKKVSQNGTGGDDKCGIWVALECLKRFDNIKAVFFRDEERGCLGSGVCDMSFFEDTGMVLQSDRRGRKDLTDFIGSQPMLNKEFKEAAQDIINEHGRLFVTGGMTDVQRLAERGLKVCAANMSCGYYEPHTDKEYINLQHMQEAFDFTAALIGVLGDRAWPYENRSLTFNRDNALSRTYYGGSTVYASGGTVIKNELTLYPPEGPYNDTGLDAANKTIRDNRFRTQIIEYCEGCGAYLETIRERAAYHCEKCYKEATGDSLY